MDKNLDLTDRVLAKLRSGTVTAAPRPATGAPAAAPLGGDSSADSAARLIA